MFKKIVGGIVLGMFFAGCGSEAGDRDSEATGTISAALTMPSNTHDVFGVAFKVVGGGESCDAEALAETTVALEEEAAPASVLPSGSGPNHAFADGLFVLPPGDYHVCATPVREDGSPSEECAPTAGDATVFEAQTTEITLISQCEGVDNGGLDVVVSLNDPPRITDLDIATSKFITTCDQATITVTASDPNGDELSFEFSQISGPADAGIAQDGSGIMTFATNVAGDYEVQVVVIDAQGGTTELTFPIHVQEGDCAPNVCDGGVDVGTGGAWVVCAADEDRAWVSADSFGVYHLDLICQELGYASAARYGGNCGFVCGYCDWEMQTSCENHGREIFDGQGDCGQDELGRLICFTVTWECVN